MPTLVTLTPHEEKIACLIGLARHTQAVDQGRGDRHGMITDAATSIMNHRLGVAGEMAFAKAFDFYWTPTVGTYQEGHDVGIFEVRTRGRHHYDLIVRPGDKDDSPYVLVTHEGWEFRIHGWMLGADAKQEKYLQTHGARPPAYFVPQTDLKVHQFDRDKKRRPGAPSPLGPR